MNRQIGAVERMHRDEETAQRKKLTDAQKRRRADELRPLRQRKEQLGKAIAERERPPAPSDQRGPGESEGEERDGENREAVECRVCGENKRAGR